MRKAFAHIADWIDYVLSDDFEAPYTTDDRFVCRTPARIIYYAPPRGRHRCNAQSATCNH